MQKGFFKVLSVHTGDVLYFLDAENEEGVLEKVSQFQFGLSKNQIEKGGFLGGFSIHPIDGNKEILDYLQEKADKDIREFLATDGTFDLMSESAKDSILDDFGERGFFRLMSRMEPATFLTREFEDKSVLFCAPDGSLLIQTPPRFCSENSDAKEEFRRLAKIGAVVFDVEEKGYKVVPKVLAELKKEYSF